MIVFVLYSHSLELWYYAILVLLAGYMQNAEVAISAFSIWYASNLNLIFYSCIIEILLLLIELELISALTSQPGYS